MQSVQDLAAAVQRVVSNVERVIAERERLFAAMQQIPRIRVFPTRANFITFRAPKPLFDALWSCGILIREVAGGCLRVSIGSREQNDAFLRALKEVV